MKTNSNIVIATVSAEGYEVQTKIFLRSLCEFGGELSNLPVWIYYPEGEPLSPKTQKTILNLGAELFSFPGDDSFSQFPFALKTIASGQAEKRADNRGLTLAWHDRTGYFNHQPAALELPPNKAIAFRPTDIANIGAPFGKDLPPFWQTLCDHFQLSLQDFPPITTAIDQKQLHLYVNAGLLVVRPEKNILRTWAKNLQQTYALPKFQSFYRENPAYAIFLHQAVLTAAVVQQTSPNERFLLPDSYLFSVDNFFDYPKDSRPDRLDEITTGRFHDFFALDNWEEKIIASEALVQWFHKQLQEGPYWPDD
jgi:hypothetical protein